MKRLFAGLCLALVFGVFLPPAPAMAADGPAGLKNRSFEEGLDSLGVPKHWQGDGKRLKILPTDAADGKHAIRLAPGGSISQTLPAGDALSNYTMTVRADTTLFEEPTEERFRSEAYLELTFLPSNKRVRTEMASPFGQSRRWVEYAVGGAAPAGTQSVRVTISTVRAEIAVDDVRLVAHRPSTTQFRLKPLYLETAIVEGGKPAARIVVPQAGPLRALGEQLAAKIRELTGTKVSLVDDRWLDLCRDQRLGENLIVVGSRDTNRVVSDLYDLYYCILDGRYPGKGGSVVRSVHNPFGDGHNVILAGGSDAAGTEKAVQALLQALDRAGAARGRLTLGRLALIQLGEDVKIPREIGLHALQEIAPWDATAGTGGYGWNVLTKCMAYYYLTGNEFYAREFLRLAFPADKKTIDELVACGQDFLADRKEPLVNVYHYRGHLPVVYWDLIEESPVFTDADRERVTRQFMKQVEVYRSDDIYGCQIDRVSHPASYVNSRHHQWGAMTFFTLGRYLGKDYPDYSWKEVRRAAENFFAPLFVRPHFTNVGENVHLERFPTTLVSMFDYTLMSGNKEPVRVGSLQDQTRNLEILLDWTPNAWSLRQAPTNLFHKMTYLLENRRYLAVRDLTSVASEIFRPGQSYWPGESAGKFEPFAVRRWESWRPAAHDLAGWATSWEEPLPHKDDVFRVTSFRTSNDGRGDFLLFEGVHTGGVYRSFAMLEYVLNGNALFMGERTQLGIISDGMTAVRQPRYSRLERMAATGQSALICAGVQGYNSMDWQRSVLHRQGKYTLFADKLIGRESIASSTVEIAWTLAENVKAERLTPVGAAIRVDGVGAGKPVYELSALRDPTVKLSTNLPAEQLMRTEYDAVMLGTVTKGDYLDVAFTTDRDLEGDLLVELLGYRRSGLVRIKLDGAVLVDQVSAYHRAGTRVPVPVAAGYRTLKAGPHVLRIENLGPAPGSEGARIFLRGFKLLDRPASADYALSWSDKLKASMGEAGTTIGSGAGGGLLTAAWSGAINKGQKMVLFSLVRPAAEGMDAALGNCVAIGPNDAVLALPGGHALAVVGGHRGVQAGIALLGTDHMAAYDATVCGPLVAADAPVDVDWDFPAATLAIECRQKCVVTLALESDRVQGADEKPLSLRSAGANYQIALPPGTHVLRGATPRTALVERIRRSLDADFADAAAQRRATPIKDKPVAVAASPWKPVWQSRLGGFAFDARPFVHRNANFMAVAAGKNVTVLDENGTLRQTLRADDLVKVVHYWPETGQLVAGCRDFKVIAFDPDSGRRTWVFQSTEINPEMKKAGNSGWFDRSPEGNHGIHALTSGVFLDGKNQLLAGSASTVEALDQTGRLVRSMNANPGVVTDIALLDCGDGEIRMFPAKLFGTFWFLQTSSKSPEKAKGVMVGPFTPWRAGAAYSNLLGSGYAAVQAVDLDGDGRQELVGLFNGLLNGVHVWDRKGVLLGSAAMGDGPRSPQPSWEPQIPAVSMRGMAIADLDGDGTKELCLITSRGFAILLSWKCDKRWSIPMPAEPLAIEAFDADGQGKGRVVVGCRDGSVWQLDAQGKFLATGRGKGSAMKAVKLTPARTVIVDTEGDATAWDVR